jgi:hypothetical protein
MLKFKEARGVMVQRELFFQLRTKNFRSMLRQMDQFAARVHHNIYLFVIERCASIFDLKKLRQRIRAFKVGEAPERAAARAAGIKKASRWVHLEEVVDQATVNAAWAEFLVSRKLNFSRHGYDNLDEGQWDWRAQEERHGMPKDILHRLRRELKCMLMVPACSSIVQYGASPGPGALSCMSFKGACNTYAGDVGMPLLVPAWEVFPDFTQNRNVAGLLEGVMKQVRRDAILKEGVYARTMADSRVCSINLFLDKSMLVC